MHTTRVTEPPAWLHFVRIQRARWHKGLGWELPIEHATVSVKFCVFDFSDKLAFHKRVLLPPKDLEIILLLLPRVAVTVYMSKPFTPYFSCIFSSPSHDNVSLQKGSPPALLPAIFPSFGSQTLPHCLYQ